MPSADPVLPSKQTAIVADGPGRISVHNDVPVPVLRADMAIVKTLAVAINPVDAKMLDYSPVAGTIQGYDFAGTIIALGRDAPGHLSVGDRVAGMVQGMNALQPDIGGFAEYVGARADLVLKIPETMSFQDGASLGMGLMTSLLALFRKLDVPGCLDASSSPSPSPSPPSGQSSTASPPATRRAFVLVSGGSTATGTRALQLLKLAGLRPIATCSPANFDLARRFGAEEVFDYRSPTCATDIRKYTGNTLAHAFDCISQADTTQLCYSAIGRAGGRYVALEPYRDAIAVTRPTVDASWLMALTIFGRKVDLHGEFGRDACPEDLEFGIKMTRVIQSLLDKGFINPHPIKLMSGGWDGVIEGVNIIRNEAMSGRKLVYAV